ncbi:MAG: ABC transporter ATP-binding protein [Clostridia bacterium]|nr:ABC transporter ATP-binding protein [Clostridia bacterium]
MILELKNIYKTYMQGKIEVPVLKDINLSVEKGDYLAIMGPSGSGKTTLMNIIGCLDKATSGTYYLAGNDIQSMNDNQLSSVRLKSIGFVFQSFNLLPKQSALQNVALPLLYAGVRPKERKELARKALERVGLGDRVNFNSSQLSGGQCQRVAIARALVNKPDIILADEPTGALDQESGRQVMELFRQLNDEGVTILMITHDANVARHAKKIKHILDGRIYGNDEIIDGYNPFGNNTDSVSTEVQE